MNQPKPKSIARVIWITVAVVGVMLTFLLQDFSWVENWSTSDDVVFILRKTFRVVLNDIFMLIFISNWFQDWKITRLAIFIQLLDGLILLPLYLFLKLHFEGTSEISSPLLSQFHRLIINPTFMILLIPAVYFQKFSARE